MNWLLHSRKLTPCHIPPPKKKVNSSFSPQGKEVTAPGTPWPWPVRLPLLRALPLRRALNRNLPESAGRTTQENNGGKYHVVISNHYELKWIKCHVLIYLRKLHWIFWKCISCFFVCLILGVTPHLHIRYIRLIVVAHSEFCWHLTVWHTSKTWRFSVSQPQNHPKPPRSWTALSPEKSWLEMLEGRRSLTWEPLAASSSPPAADRVAPRRVHAFWGW